MTNKNICLYFLNLYFCKNAENNCLQIFKSISNQDFE